MMKYNVYKLFHIAGLIAWLGPSSGVYVAILLSRFSDHYAIEMWLRWEYLYFIYIETAGLLTIILSGLGMLISTQWRLKSQWWLRVKGLIVLFIFIPLEFVQLYLYLGPVRSALTAGTNTENAILYFDRFSAAASILLAIFVPAAMILGICKPRRN